MGRYNSLDFLLSRTILAIIIAVGLIPIIWEVWAQYGVSRCPPPWLIP